jgi:two-component system CheB/CheR fusion protein
MNPGLAIDETDERLEELLYFIRDARGFDFTGYKRSSLGRRIRKRMNDAGVKGYADYRDLLETDTAEFAALFNTILINVTSFFRDPECWSYLQRQVLPELIGARSEGEIRVWSAGCSTGEEPYSLAMAFAEVMGVEECVRRVKIYGTDVDEDALRQARNAQYPAKSIASVPDELRDQYFEPNGDSYTFRSDLRRRVIFGRHDITRDAPISRLDLLVCRNTLMYFNVEAQTEIVDRFHYSLRDRGHLFLGKAEMLLSESDRFEVASMRQRIFRRRASGAGIHDHAAALLEGVSGRDLPDSQRRRELRDLTLEVALYAIILIDADGTVSMFNDQAREMFKLAARDLHRPFHDLDFSYRPVELRSLIERAERERHHVRVAGAERRRPDGQLQYLDVLIQPLFERTGRTAGTAVTFVDTTEATQLQHEVQRVREDLERAYETLQSTNEELETTNEELQSSIEELETTNEELQSTNEELETTNEELESGNEELETMNEEMRVRALELEEARSFLDGVLASIVAGVVVLDAQLRVRSWNRGAEELWGLRGNEVIREPFFTLDFGLAVADLRAIVEECRTTRRRTGPVTFAAVNRIGRTISCSVACSPLDDHGDGVVLLMEELRPG